jgi:hypothetical protein
MTTEIPCAALPSKMLPGVAEFTIEFPTGTDRALFSVAVNIAHERGLAPVDALSIAYEVASATSPVLYEIDCGDCALYYAKGVVSPLVAIEDARRHWTGEGYPMMARHVWLRFTVGGWSGEYSSMVESGNPGGRGGSFKATLVGSPEDINTYRTLVDVKTSPGRVTKQWLEAWQAYVESVTC